MGSVSDNKHSKVAAIIGAGLRGNEKDRDKAVRELIKLCEDDIAVGLSEGGGAMAFTTPEDVNELALYLFYASAERLMATARGRRPENLPTYVQECAAQVARETREAQEAKLREFSPEYVLDMALRLPRPGAASVTWLLKTSHSGK